MFQILLRKFELGNWIQKNQNLLHLRKKLRAEIPKDYLRGFYRIWLYDHLMTRLKHKDDKNRELAALTLKISPTMRCNLSCKGCFASNYPPSEDLTLETMKRLIGQASSAGIPSVGVIGGEPLLVPAIFELFRLFPNMGFYLVTNGLLVDEFAVKELKKLPNVVTIFSLEGFRETTDDLRGEGVYDRIVSAMRLMAEAKLIFGFSTVVHKENLNEVISKEFIDSMIENRCFFGGFLPYIPVGSHPRYDVVCSQQEVSQYYSRLDVLTRSKPILILKEGYDDGTFLNSGCGAGHTIHVTARGEAEPCNGIEFSTHNIHHSAIADILFSDFFRDIRALLKKYGNQCLTINRPEEILRIIQKYRAIPTHDKALEHLEGYIHFKHRDRTAENIPVP